MTRIAIKAIKPKRNFAQLGQKIVQQQRRQLERDVLAMKADYEKTTATWKHKPLFETRVLMAGGVMTGLVFTEDEIFKFVDGGTRPHQIKPRRYPALRFKTGYNAKTRPGVLSSRSGGPFGKYVYAKQVNHPGTEARGFSEAITKKYNKVIPKHMADIIRQII